MTLKMNAVKPTERKAVRARVRDLSNCSGRRRFITWYSHDLVVSAYRYYQFRKRHSNASRFPRGIAPHFGGLARPPIARIRPSHLFRRGKERERKELRERDHLHALPLFWPAICSAMQAAGYRITGILVAASRANRPRIK